MRKLFFIAFLITAWAITYGVSFASEIVIYSPFPDELIQALAKPFTEKTGIKVSNMVISSGEILARIKAERARPQADFWLSVRALYLKEAIEQTPPLIEAYKPKIAQEVLEQYRYSGVNYLVGVGMYPLIFFYNKNTLEKKKLAPPRNWEDLLDPKWKGEIVMPHPATSGTAYSTITTILQMFPTEEEGWEYIKKLAVNMAQFTRSGRAPQTMVARGEYALGIGFFDAVYWMIEEGYPIVPVFPEPIYAEPYCAAVVAGARNPEGARKFFDFLLTKEAQEVLTKFGNYSVRPDVTAPKYGIPLTQMKILKDDYIWAAKNRKTILKKFQDLVQAEPAGK